MRRDSLRRVGRRQGNFSHVQNMSLRTLAPRVLPSRPLETQTRNSPGATRGPQAHGADARRLQSQHVVNFDDRYSCRLVLAAHDRRVVAGNEGGHKGRFQIVRRWDSRRFNLGLLTAVVFARLPTNAAKCGAPNLITRPLMRSRFSSEWSVDKASGSRTVLRT